MAHRESRFSTHACASKGSCPAPLSLRVRLLRRGGGGGGKGRECLGSIGRYLAVEGSASSWFQFPHHGPPKNANPRYSKSWYVADVFWCWDPRDVGRPSLSLFPGPVRIFSRTCTHTQHWQLATSSNRSRHGTTKTFACVLFIGSRETRVGSSRRVSFSSSSDVPCFTMTKHSNPRASARRSCETT
jgi:hypothetical protein